MTKHEFKPGDIAALTFEDVDGEVWGVLDLNDDWNLIGDVEGGPGWLSDESRLTARPLVVLDPDDREQVTRLLNAYWIERSGEGGVEEFPEYVTGMQAALRSLVSPPRPPEPTGLGAVVEDTDGDLLVHIGNGDWVTAGGESVPWPAIAVAALRSDGVPL